MVCLAPVEAVDGVYRSPVDGAEAVEKERVCVGLAEGGRVATIEVWEWFLLAAVDGVCLSSMELRLSGV